ncbi:SDR family NAD(P)-dependent oxidoreductase [Nocardia sp. NPDC058518]|uniref:SDR family NAD(P)-dependent oxidoreductase n=1 Tax=Nocardia sp. NPDC058518 TaxID=3346534 RepID=UPI0036542008
MSFEEVSVDGRNVVITGATNGIGKEMARALARRGAALTIPARNISKAREIANELAAEPGATSTPRIVLCDMADLVSVRRAAEEIRTQLGGIDLLIANAGVNMTTPAVTAEGLDTMMATNHLGPFLLTNLLMDQLTDSARVVVTASEGHRLAGRIDFDGLGAPRDYGPLTSQKWYGQTKLLNILFTQHLAQRFAESRLDRTANCFCPGVSDTGVMGGGRAMARVMRAGVALGVVGSAGRGAALGVRLALDTSLATTNGAFFTNTRMLRRVPSRALRDIALRGKAWERSLALVGPV